MTNYVDMLPVAIAEAGAVLPDGFDSWGIKSVHPDLRTTRGYRWALPGGTSVSADHLDRSNLGACPKRPGDGLCVATTWRGMASGGVPARTLLLVAYRHADVVGSDDVAGKLRIGGQVASVALVDGERLIREHGKRANLRGADLQGTNLRNAVLRGAELRGADLRGADLQDANLQDASLRYAQLRGADLQDVRWTIDAPTPDGWALTDAGTLTRAGGAA